MRAAAAKRWRWVSGVAAILCGMAAVRAPGAALNLVPWPAQVVLGAGSFAVGAGTRIVPGEPALAPLAGVLAGEFELGFGLALAVDAGAPAAGNIRLALNGSFEGEAQRLTVAAGGVLIEAGNVHALAAATVTLLQAVAVNGGQVTIPTLTVNDQPFVGYRGLMIDVARQPHSVATLKRIIQLCRLYKIRYLQLHLTDDQGFKFPSTAFPLLATQNYSGPAYTLAELRGLEQYSQERGVTIIPEFEIPGHSAAMIHTMPDLFKIKGTLPYEHHATVNWAKPEVMAALEVLIGEICEVFQATPYFHIGGDEADFTYAHQNEYFIQRFQELGYAAPFDSADTAQLFRRLLRTLNGQIATNHGKQMLVWEGFHRDQSATPLEPVPKTIPVMAFENTYYPANQLVADGYPVINTAWNPLYVVNGVQVSPENIYGWNIYQFGRFQPDWNQVQWITAPSGSNVIGAQMCAWEQPENIEIDTLRSRLPAMSERIWNPDAGKTYMDFSARVAATDALLSRLAEIDGSAPRVDISGLLTTELDTAVGAGNAARLVGNTQTHWGSTNSSADVALNGYQFTINTGGGNAQTYSGAFTGPGTLRFQGRGDATWEPDMRLGGTLANTPTGALLSYGRVQLNKPPGVDALAGAITVNTTQTVRLQLLASNQINDASTLTSTTGGGVFHLDLGGFEETIGRLEMKAGDKVNTGIGGILKVTTLKVGGVELPKGSYTVNSGFVTGSGYIDVDNAGPPVIANPPGVPGTPSPAAAANNVHPAYLAKLTWAITTDATSYDVYLWLAAATKPGTPTANVVLPEFSVSPQVLSLSNYKWQVVAKNSAGNTAGPEWTFATVDRRDISGNLTQTLSAIIGAGPARLIANARTYWAGTTAAADINLNGFEFTINNGGGNTQTYNGAITGPGTLRIEGRGDASWPDDIMLGGTLANSPAGVTLASGRCRLNKPAGVDALAGPITVNTSGTVRIQLLKSNQINDASTITSTASSGAFYLEMGGFSDTISGLAINTGHQVDTGTGGVLTVANLTVGGTVMPPGTYTSSAGFVTGTGSVVVPGATTTPADAITSTVAASPSSVAADGVSTSTIMVTLKNSSGSVVSGKTVTLASSRGATDTVAPATGVSNGSGIVIFTVASTTVGTPVFTATDTTDGITLSQTASVTFTAAATNVVDISNALTPWEPANPAAGVKIDGAVPSDKTGRLVGVTQTHWTSGGFSRPVDLNGNTLIIDSGGGNACAASGAIFGTGLVRVNAGGIGIIHLNGNTGNTYTGATEINNGPVKLGKTAGNALNGTITVNGVMSNNFPGTGTLLWGANNQVNDTSNLTLTAGSSINFNGFSDTMGTLALTGDASIYLTGNTSVARFADSSAATWATGTQLIIREWNGSPTGGGAEAVFFGTSAGGLSAGQIAKVGFMNPAGFATGLYHAAILATGEVLPTGTAVMPTAPPYDLSPAATTARTASYTSTGRADLTAAGSPLATGTRIVFFGDSITWQNTYINFLNATIASGAGTQGKTITLINRGINGGIMADLRDGKASGGYPGSVAQASFSSLLTSDQATIAVVFIGINDIWWAGTTAAAYEQGLRDLAATAAAKGVRLIFATPAAHNESPVGAGADDAKINQFAGIVEAVAAASGSTFVDLRSAFVAYWRNNNYEIRLDGSFVTLKPFGLLTYDGVHPTPLGNQMIAEKMADGILASYPVGSAFDAWVGTSAGGKGLTGEAAAFDADPDGDGLPNGIEFVIGGEPNPANPGSNSRALLPTAVASGNNLVFTYTRTHAAANLNPVVEFDADLQGMWTTANAGNATIQVTPGTTADTVTVTIPRSTNSKLFARLKVVATP